MKTSRRQLVWSAIACLAAVAVFADEPRPKPRDALRQIVQEQCIVHQAQKQDPAPCIRLTSSSAILADRKGAGHFLLIPTKTMAGIDGSELLDPDTPNFFAMAWAARDQLAGFVGHPVPRDAVGLAANNVHSRTQDQFHIHIECLRPEVAKALRATAGSLTDRWQPIAIAGSTYDALRVMGEDLGTANPFELLAAQKPAAKPRIGDYTFVVAGMTYDDGPGFVLLTGTGPTGELLLDASCAAAG